MTVTLEFGQQTFRIDLPQEKQVSTRQSTTVQPLADPRATVRAALEDPISFPSLPAALVSDDRVVITLEAGVPHAADVVRGVLDILLQTECCPADIRILYQGISAAESSLAEMIASEYSDEIQVISHDPADEKHHAYLAASKSDLPIYLNRLIVDADVVIPIGVARFANAPGYLGVHGGLFPHFSNLQTRQRIQQRQLQNLSTTQDEVNEAAWLLGVQFTVQVVPGPHESVLGILCGEANAVEAEAQQVYQSGWQHIAPQSADLVIASIDGAAEQNWHSFARALSLAHELVNDGGAILICSEIEKLPEFFSDHHSESDAAAEEQTELQTGWDWLNEQLQSQQKAKQVYLLSRLTSEQTEQLGLIPVEAAEIERLCDQHESFLVLSSAHHSCCSLQQEESSSL